MIIVNGLPHTPYYIFIKGVNYMSDKEVLQFFHLENFRELSIQDESSDINSIYISRDKNWIHLMDNLGYTFWLSSQLSNRVDELSYEYEIFTCSVGDCDLSFDFKYFKNGSKVREYIVESPNHTDEILTVNYGLPLPNEEAGLKVTDELERMIFLASSLGIELPNELLKIRRYEIDSNSTANINHDNKTVSVSSHWSIINFLQRAYRKSSLFGIKRKPNNM